MRVACDVMRTDCAGRIYIWLPVLAVILSGVGVGLHLTGVARKIPWVKRFYAKKNAEKRTTGRSAMRVPTRPVSTPPQRETATASIRDAALRTPAVPPAPMPASAPPLASTPTTAPKPSPQEQRLLRVARLFEAMQPEEAAAIVEKMRDPDVERVLSKMRDRYAARLLAALKPERAALIAKSMASEVKTP